MNVYEATYEYQPPKVKGTALIEAENVLEAEKQFLQRFKEEPELNLTKYHIRRKEINNE